jgi:hypothetical protein
MKARYIGKSYEKQFGRCIAHLEYEYRGMRYEVIEDIGRGNEPLAWQHKSEQTRIDRILDTKQTVSKEIDLDEIFALLEMDC